jgi:maleate isomerase
MLEYCRVGIIGVLTPQANTTVEPELSILCPEGVCLLTARLTSNKTSMDDRLVDYVVSMDETLDRFANAPLKAVIFACTGAAYLVDPDVEKAKLSKIEDLRGYPIITAADALAEALKLLKAYRVGIISPYGDPLHAKALKYWEIRGLEITAVHRIRKSDKNFHPIYSLLPMASKKGLSELNTTGAQAVVILGTGLPTLSTLIDTPNTQIPTISPNICLMWRAHIALLAQEPSIENLMPWVSGKTWSKRLLKKKKASEKNS